MDYVALRRLQLQHNGFALSKTYGQSMRPLIWGGEHCVAVAPLDGEPEPGDLLLFRQALPDGTDRNIVHRLVDVRLAGDRRVYVTRGDNCLGCEIVRRSEIIGRVAEVHRTTGFRPWHVIPKMQFSVTDPVYLRYSRIWAAIWPARRLYYILRAHAYALYVGLMSKIKKVR